MHRGRCIDMPAEGHNAVSKRLAIVAPDAASLLRLRSGLIRDAVARRHRVLCLAPEAGPLRAGIEKLGAEFHAVDLKPPGLGFLADRKAEGQLARLLGEWRADAVLGCGLRPLAIAALAGRRAGVRCVLSLVNGLAEHGLSRPDEDGVSSRRLARALKVSDAIIVHNGDDGRRLAEHGLVASGTAIVKVPGGGVDLDHYGVQPLPRLDNGLVFLMLAPMARSRGVGEYAGAAKALKARAPAAKFLLAGSEVSGTDAITLQALDGGHQTIEHLGLLDDVRPSLARCHVYVYPSRAEGMPRSVLEALAAGRPVITTDTAGCRETVDERINGCLVPPRDPAALAEAMESFLKRPDLIASMARASREKAERRFDMRDVNKVLLQAMELA